MYLDKYTTRAEELVNTKVSAEEKYKAELVVLDEELERIAREIDEVLIKGDAKSYTTLVGEKAVMDARRNALESNAISFGYTNEDIEKLKYDTNNAFHDARRNQVDQIIGHINDIRGCISNIAKMSREYDTVGHCLTVLTGDARVRGMDNRASMDIYDFSRHFERAIGSPNSATTDCIKGWLILLGGSGISWVGMGENSNEKSNS